MNTIVIPKPFNVKQPCHVSQYWVKHIYATHVSQVHKHSLWLIVWLWACRVTMTTKHLPVHLDACTIPWEVTLAEIWQTVYPPLTLESCERQGPTMHTRTYRRARILHHYIGQWSYIYWSKYAVQSFVLVYSYLEMWGCDNSTSS